MRLRFREGEVQVTVEVDPPDLAGAVAALFSHHRAEGPAATDAEEGPWDMRVAWGGVGEGYRLDVRDPGADGLGETLHESLPDLLVRLELLLLRQLLRPLGGCVHLHAAGTVVGGRALLALGPSGAGKSSLALAWSAAGLPVLGDDLIPLGADHRVRAFPRLAKIDRARLAGHGLTEGDTVSPVAGEVETWVDLHSGKGPPPGAYPVGWVGRIELDPSLDEPRVEPLAPSALLAHLVESLLDTGLSDEAALDALLPVAEGARGVRLCFGRSEAGARFLLDLARSDLP